MILGEVIEKTKEDLDRKKRVLPFEILGRSLSSNPFVPREIKPALTASKQQPYKIIAKVKQTPNKDDVFEPLQIAISFEKSGANALSVGTEPNFAKGNLEYISFIRRYTQIPILRDDFIIDEYQILESCIYGADFVLLIASILSNKELKNLIEFSQRLGIEALVEVHNKDDIKKAIFAGASIIGINHINLENSKLDMNLCQKLIPILPNGKIIVAKGGLGEHKQLVELHKIGVDAFLIDDDSLLCHDDDVNFAFKNIKGA